MKKATMIAVLFVACKTAFALPPCQGGVAMFANPQFMQMGEEPRTDCVYSLNMTTPLQRVKDGYLLAEAFTQDPDQTGVVFLKTKANIESGQIIQTDDFARYAGKASYQGLDGFDHAVYMFTLEGEKR